MVERNLDTLIAIDLNSVLLNNDPLIARGLGLLDNAFQIKNACSHLGHLFEVHRLIHSTLKETIDVLRSKFGITEPMVKLINQYRNKCGLEPI